MTILCFATVPKLSQAQDSTKTRPKNFEARKALREKWQNATPEQKGAFKEKLKNRRNATKKA